MLKRSRPETAAETMVRFWSKVKIDDGCWLWTASTVRGYGQFRTARVNGKQPPSTYAHRFAWEITNGPIPAGQVVCHRCDTPLCVNPAHLFLGTQQENLTDARRKGRLDERLPRAPFTLDIYREIVLTDRRSMYFVRKYGVTKVSVYRIRHGLQGAAIVQAILQDQTSQSEIRLRRRDVSYQGLEPVSTIDLEIRGEVG